MARHDDLDNPIKYSDPWDGMTGSQVENAITEAIDDAYAKEIVGGEYSNPYLTLTKKDGTTVPPIEITVMTPDYAYGIYVYAIRVDGKVYKGGLSEQTIQYNKDKKFEIGIAVYATATTTYVAQRNVSLQVDLTYGRKSTTINVATTNSEYFVLDDTNAVSGIQPPEGETVESIVKWVDVGTLFSDTYTAGTLLAELIPDQETKTSILTYGFSTPITIQVISLSYAGAFYTNGSQITFTLNGGNTNNYVLEGKNGDDDIISSGMTVQLNPGLNKLVVRAKFATDKSIHTDCYYLDIIRTSNFSGTAVAINKVSDVVPNNAIATLYDLTVYSSEKESTTIATYLSEIDPSGTPDPTIDELLKTQVITKDDYDSDLIFNTTYYKYIESLNNKEAGRYLMVKVDNDWYTFYTEEDQDGEFSTSHQQYKTMTLGAVTEEYCYYRTGVTYNFDQINGRNNNVFVTKEYAESVGAPANIPDNIEVTDGWVEDAGVLYFKISAQDQAICTLSDLNLGNEFTFETKFKTYNVSDKTTPILTFGNIQLLPTQLAFKGDSDKRNSIFRKDTIVHLLVTVKRNFTISTTDPYYPDYMTNDAGYENSFQQKFDQAMSSTTNSANKFNLVRVFINGCIDREYVISDDEFTELRASSITINPTTSDVNFYLLRLYNQTALDFTQIQQNYISSLTNDVSKEDDNPKKSFYDKNDLVGDNGIISFAKTYKKYNTILLVFPKDPVNPNRTNYVPSRAWGGKDNSDPHPNDYLPVTLFINYSDETKNKKYGGRLTNTRVRGQGTSAMRYWIWNVTTHITKAKKYVTNEDGTLNTGSTEKAKSKFTPYKNLDPKTNTFVDNPVDVLKKYYLMPDDDDTKVTKAVGKVNFASSMQNHKMGAADLYNSFYKSEVTDFKVGGTSLGGYKAVKEEPFIYFYTYADEYDVSKWELADVLAADANNKVKFMGFMTWGSGKGDNETFAIDSDRTPGYFFLEGGENGDQAVQFRVPWQALQRNRVSWTNYNDSTHESEKLMDVPQISYEESLERPWDNLLISGDESIIYNPATADVTGAWDVNVGLEELDNGEFRLDVGSDSNPNKYLRQSVKTWREFYDFVYTHDWDIKFTSDTDCNNWDTSRKVCCTASTCNVEINNGKHTAKDVYRYNTLTNKWVRAGVKFDTEAQEWEAFNLGTINSSNEAALRDLRKEFVNKIAYKESEAATSGPLDTKDASIHQALIRLLSGTDNRAKNTYFRVVGPIMASVPVMDGDTQKVDSDGNPMVTWEEPADYTENPRKYHFVGFLQDDLDTVLATDNNGLQTKEYNLLEPSYYDPDDEEEAAIIKNWGDNGKNVFFRCYDQAFEEDIINELHNLLDHAFNSSKTVTDSSNNFYKYFFETQNSMFPAIAYNHTAKIYYELGQLVLNTKAISEFGSNDENPIEQSHGSCIESELSFMEQRLRFLGSQAKAYTDVSNVLALNAGSGTGGGSGQLSVKINYKVSQDLYPNYQKTGYEYFQDNGNNNSFTNTNYKPYLDSIARNRLAYTAQEYSHTFKDADSINNRINQMDIYSYLELIGYEGNSLGDATYSNLQEIKIDNNNRGSFPESAFTKAGWVPNFPVAKKITFANMQLPTSLNFESCTKLEELNLSGSKINVVYLPKTTHLTTVTLPTTITYFGISNAPNLTTVTFEGLENLETVDINCDKTPKFDLNQFCEDLVDCSKLASVTLDNADLTLSINALKKLVSAKAKITGTITVGGAIDFALKTDLMALYGNIDDESNSLYIQYSSQEVTSISCNTQVSIYGKGEKGNPFGLSISEGNNVAFKLNSAGTTWIPDITYAFTTSVSKIAKIDSESGNVTMLVDKNESTTTTVKITVKTTTQTFTKTIPVSFKWIAPAVGNFVYADGSYLSAYITSKTLMGMIFDVDEDAHVMYILGKEYLDAQYVGFASIDSSYNNATDSRKNLFLTGKWLDSLNSNLSSSYYKVDGVSSTITNGENIDRSTTLCTSTTYTGKQDTQLYVEHVNTNLLPLLIKSYSKYIQTTSEGTYSIASKSNLDEFLKKLAQDTTSYGGEVTQCLLFPYFYETYLYEPSVQSGETLNSAFQKGNWYIPCADELSNIIYYRGYSVEGDSFYSSDAPMNSINANLSTTSTAKKDQPIFSVALKSMGAANMPTAWTNIAGTDNLCTTQSTSHYGNYTYQRVYKWDGTLSSCKFVEGVKNTNEYSSYGESASQDYGWRVYTHKPIPCVQLTYTVEG